MTVAVVVVAVGAVVVDVVAAPAVVAAVDCRPSCSRSSRTCKRPAATTPCAQSSRWCEKRSCTP